MSIESEIFSKYQLQPNKLLLFGFTQDANGYHYTRAMMDNEFIATITIDQRGNVSGKVVDADFGEEYAPLRVEEAQGNYVEAVRFAYREVLEEIRTACFISIEEAKRNRAPIAWVLPSNPKHFDVLRGFAESGDVLNWHQRADVHVGDTVYIYVGTPISAIRFRCEAIAVNLPPTEEEPRKSMNIKRLETYADDQWPRAFLLANGLNNIRGLRTIPMTLHEIILRGSQNT